MTANTTDAARAGGDAARTAPDEHSLIRRHMGMAGRIAAGYRGRLLDDDELESVAYLGLVEAARKYDLLLHGGESFARYAERVIRSHLRDALAMAPVVRMSRDAERSALRGGAAPRWAPSRIPAERMGTMTAPSGDDRAEALGDCLAECTDRERELVALMYCDGLTAVQAGHRLGLGRREARDCYRGAMSALESAYRRRGFELPMAHAC